MTSFSHLQLFVIDYQVTPVNFSSEVRIESEHQGNVRNYCNPNDPRVAGESFQHLIPDHGTVVNGASYLVTNTATSGLQVCTGVKNTISADEVQTGEIVLEGHHAVQKFTVSAKQGEAIRFVKYMVFADSIRYEDVQEAAQDEMEAVTAVPWMCFTKSRENTWTNSGRALRWKLMVMTPFVQRFAIMLTS